MTNNWCIIEAKSRGLRGVEEEEEEEEEEHLCSVEEVRLVDPTSQTKGTKRKSRPKYKSVNIKESSKLEEID